MLTPLENKLEIFEKLFENNFQDQNEYVRVIEYDFPYSKDDFLKFLVENKNILLHGTSNKSLEILEPKQANDGAKLSGNKKAVYAVSDPVMAIFFAIQNREKINGTIESGTWDNPETGKQEYKFKIPKSSHRDCWTNGVVYLLDKKDFTPEKDDDGDFSGEWTSEIPIKPVAKIEITPEDFKYLDQVKFG